MAECEKKAFRSRREAREFANAVRNGYGKQRPYRCTDDDAHWIGGIWHLTSARTNDVTWYRDHPQSSRRIR